MSKKVLLLTFIILTSFIPLLQVFSIQLAYMHFSSIFSPMYMIQVDDLAAAIAESMAFIRELLSTVCTQVSSTLKNVFKSMLLDLPSIFLVPLSSSLIYNNKRLRVYFDPCGIALGHAGRCLPVAERLKKMFDGDVDILV